MICSAGPRDGASWAVAQPAPGWLPLLSVGEHRLPSRGARGHADGAADPVTPEALRQPPAVAAPGAQWPDRTALSAAAWAHQSGCAEGRHAVAGAGVRLLAR